MSTVLVISQTFVPDPAAVGQYMADVAFALAQRGHRVRVYASGRGYENPTARYPTRENLHGVDVRRFPHASFGKKSIFLRVLGTAVFMTQAFFAALLTPNLAGIFFSTSPPLIGFPMAIAGMLRGVPVVYWAMDLNPDQLIALKKIEPASFTAHLLELINRFILYRSALIIALDRFMAMRLADRGVNRDKMLVVPPWSLEAPESPNSGPNPFRASHGLENQFVVMYSGNHSPSNPLTTALEAAVALKDNSNIKFVFVGGGSGKKEVEAYIRDRALTNTVSLPYQPMADLKYSLTAADLHIVSLGEPMVGIIHPCKIYGAMMAAKPILFLGPRPSHISDLLDQHAFGVQVSHGDVPAAVEAVRRFYQMVAAEREAIGQQARFVLEQSLGPKVLTHRFVDAVEKAFGIAPLNDK